VIREADIERIHALVSMAFKTSKKRRLESNLVRVQATWMQKFADEHRLTKTQVTNWFNNERKRRPEAGGAPGKVAKRRTRVSASLQEEDDSGDASEEVVFVEERKRTARGRNKKGQSELIVDTSRFSGRDPETTFFRRN
jgi:hypothetical protein